VERTELQTERLLLRPFRFEDVEDVTAYSADPEFWRHYWRNRARQSVEEFVTQQVDETKEGEIGLAIVLDQRVIGEIGFNVYSGDRTAELGYAIGKDYWRKGLTYEAAAAIVEWGFESLDLERIFARADVPNAGSWRIMEKLGMRREGIMRRHRVIDGERVDVVFNGLLREEWEAMR
jgi:RimJ/RimL family protein N-acetyltransferase